MPAASDVSAEVSALRRSLDQLRQDLNAVRSRYGDVPAVHRLDGDLDRFDMDVAELDGLVPVAARSDEQNVGVTLIDDRPTDPGLWADADDEGVGGYHR